eukprot:scaffold131_cov206-Alexandrium_tamarense.AAC.8
MILPGDNGDDDADGGKSRVKQTWHELYQRIESLTDAVDVVNDAAGAIHTSGSGGLGALDIELLDVVQRLDARCFVDVKPFLSSSSSAASAVVNDAASSSGVSSGKGRSKNNTKGGKKSSSSQPSSNNTARQQKRLPPITDETVLQTLSVTLRIEGLYDTMSEMYAQAVEAGEAALNDKNCSREVKNNHRRVLEEAVCVHLKATCECPSLKSVDTAGHEDGSINHHQQQQRRYTLQNLSTQQNLTKYHERMQSSCLQLAKHSGESVHFQWTAIVSLWYKESLEGLVDVLEYFHACLSSSSSDGNDDKEGGEKKGLSNQVMKLVGVNTQEIPTMCQKMKQKIALLPRLAESLSFRMIQNKQQQPDQHQQQYAPSENDWDVYLETLLAQGKKEEALDALREIPCSPLVMGTENGNNNNNNNNNSDATSVLPQIDDEFTIENHVGSILPYTQRRKLQRMAKLALELGKYDEAEGWYKELLVVFPDQWTYWLGLVDSCVVMGSGATGATINEEGWARCQSFANEIIKANEESGQHHPLRGPHLLLIELVALRARRQSDGKEEVVASLLKAICDYGNKFGPLASCCFADIRPYLGLLVRSSSMGEERLTLNDFPEYIARVIQWASELWKNNSQSSTSDEQSGLETAREEFRERRKKLRTYIFAVQVIYGVTAELNSASAFASTLAMDMMQKHTPSIPQMVSEWKTSLSFLPGLAPKDGGQKEVLPGDEIVLLVSQHVQFQASIESSASFTTSLLLGAAALLEDAIDHSPYNPHLKIAAIGIYSQLNGADRALELFEAMGVKQIQLDSCSYLIFPLLLRGGHYTQAVQLSSAVLRLHGSSSKDVKEYASRAFQNGYLFKAKEMVTFQRERMSPSLQLLYSKGLVMDCAALLYVTDLTGSKQKVVASLGAEKGLRGSEEDVSRAEQLVLDANMHFNAPSILHAASNVTAVGDVISSDNRDMTVNYFEILYRNRHLSQSEMVTESILRGHLQGLLVRAVIATGGAKAPKKGKAPKPTDETTARCQSLLGSLTKAKQFVSGGGVEMSELNESLWRASCGLCESIVAVANGGGDKTASDSLAYRESAAVSFVESARSNVVTAKESVAQCINAGDLVCKALPDRLVSLFVLLETTARLFALFGWTKRKRTTKAASGALADLALSFRDLLSAMLQITSQFQALEGGAFCESIAKDACAALQLPQSEISADAIQRAIQGVASSRNSTKDRVDPFLVQMRETLDSYVDAE